MIYYAMDELDRVKIGHSENVKKRLPDLQCANADTLLLVATEKGDKKREKEIHLRFEQQHVRGEWYKVNPDLWEYMASLPGFVYSGPILHRLGCTCGQFVYTTSREVIRGGLVCSLCDREFIKV